MTVAQQDYTWEQGEDFTLSFTYTIDNVPIDHTWQARMDIVPVTSPQTPVASLYAFNSEDLPDDPTLDVVGPEDNEITIDDNGNINIRVSRALTLSGGAIAAKLDEGTTQYQYDLFVRDSSGGNQTKIMQGQITINRSITRWL